MPLKKGLNSLLIRTVEVERSNEVPAATRWSRSLQVSQSVAAQCLLGGCVGLSPEPARLASPAHDQAEIFIGLLLSTSSN